MFKKIIIIKSKYILIPLLIFAYLFSFAQKEFIVEINRTNGSYVKIGEGIAGITYIYPNDRTFDENTGMFFFQSADISHRLYSIDVSNGSIANNPIVTNVQTFQFDNKSNILYGLERDQQNNVKKFISIDPITGVNTQIGNSLPNSSMYSGVFSTFDKTNHTYIFLDTANILCSINALNGNIISNPNLSLTSGENIVNFSFDNSTGILYGLLQDSTLQNYFLVTINPITGVCSRIGSGTDLANTVASPAIDEINQQYIYLYNNSIGYVITTLDIVTGNVLYNALIEPFTANDNFYSLKYDNTHGKLYSLHWETITTDVSESINLDNGIIVFPNPFINFIKINCGSYSNLKLKLFNVLGQIVYTSSITSNEAIYLDKFSSGIYFYQLTDELKNRVGSGKIIKE